MKRFNEFLRLVGTYGGATAGVVAFTLIVNLWISETSPLRVELNMWLEADGKPRWGQIDSFLAASFQNRFSHAEGCYLSVSKPEIEQANYSCTVTAGSVNDYFDRFDSLIGELPSQRVKIGRWDITNRAASNEVPIWSIVVAATCYLILIRICLRKWKGRDDLRAAARMIKSRPWLFLVPLVIWLVVANATAGIMGLFLEDPSGWLKIGDANLNEEASKSAYRAAIAAILSTWQVFSILMLGPLLEETVFRQALFSRFSSHRPIWVHAGVNAWFFMSAHIAIALFSGLLGHTGNPLQSSMINVPVWFSMGLFLFWVRCRYRSLSLCAGIHVFYNLVILISAYILLQFL